MLLYIVAVQAPYGPYGVAQAPLPLSTILPISVTEESPSFISPLSAPNPVYTFRTERQTTETLLSESTAVSSASFDAQNPTIDAQDLSDVVPDTTQIDPEFYSASKFLTNPLEFSSSSLPAWFGAKIKSTINYLSPLTTQRSSNPLCWLFKFSNFPCSSEASSPWDTKSCHQSSKEENLLSGSDDAGSESSHEIPSYVLEYAPFVHLCSDEQFWPGDIAEHVSHVAPYLNYIPLNSRWDHPSLKDLDELNFWKHGLSVFLTSDDDVEDHPDWLGGEKNIPLAFRHSNHENGVRFDKKANQEWEGQSSRETDTPPHPRSFANKGKKPSEPFITGKRSMKGEGGTSGKSSAPAVLIVVDKGDGIVDAFWFYFYSFNQGNVVLNVRFGNHVGDWEHTLVRFHNGVPKTLFLSEHSFGEAYSYDAVEKIGKRPVIYSAIGTHAMYATPGLHPYVLPLGLLHDRTDRGPLWDPALNFHSYTYNHTNDTFAVSTTTPDSPTGWLNFAGHWGDKMYPMSDRRQYQFAGQYHYVGGPLGPKFKDLGRKEVCPASQKERCVIRHWIGGRRRAKDWVGVGEGEEMGQEDLARLFGE